MKLHKQGHCVYQCEYHLVIVSKYRRKIFNTGSYAYFEDVMKQVLDKLPMVHIQVMNHDKDHVHIVLNLEKNNI